jgi:hypothetical protein
MITRYIVNAPCEIVHMQLGMPQEYKEQLIQESYRLKTRPNRSNQPFFSYLFHEEEDKVIGSDFKLWEESSLYNKLLTKILFTIKSLSEKRFPYGIYNTWLGIYKEGQHTKAHTHEPAYKSFCYYISADEPYTPMVFDDVGVKIDAITDRLIIFPSHIYHSVPPCVGKERIMIAGNVGHITDFHGINKLFTLEGNG